MTKGNRSNSLPMGMASKILLSIGHWVLVILWGLVLGNWTFLSAQPPEDIEKQMRPPAGIEPEPYSWWEDWPTLAIVGGVSLLGIAAGAGLALRLAGRRRAAAAETKRLPPERWALQELSRLEASALGGAGNEEAFHTELSKVVRHYIEQRFQLQATKQTTPEFLDKMKSAACLTADQQALLRSFLEQCDLVKFAGARPTREQSSEAAGAARRFIQQTA